MQLNNQDMHQKESLFNSLFLSVCFVRKWEKIPETFKIQTLYSPQKKSLSETNPVRNPLKKSQKK
jgi:hypothetical protein